jgi:glutamate dehydrogenase
MPSKAEAQQQDLIKRVAKQAGKGQTPARARYAANFMRLLFANVPPQDILGETAENLAGAGMALLDFAQQRHRGSAKVRAYNPRGGDCGWRSSHTVIEIGNDDMPFLVDSVTSALTGYDGEVHLVIHPILDVLRDSKGNIKSVRAPGDGPGGALRESFMHVEISEQPDSLLPEIESRLRRVLNDVRIAVADWRLMHQRCCDLISELENSPPKLAVREIAQGVEFLRWLNDDHFTYLGYREYRFQGQGANAVARIDKKSGLGILRDETYSVFDGLRSLGKLPAEVRDFVKQPVLLRVSKANRRSTVHRPVAMDAIAVKSFDARGKVTGERLFIGLFTSIAYSRSPREIPLLRDKVDQVLERSGFAPNSHDGKALQHIIETYPRDELFQIPTDELLEIAQGVLHLQERQRVALFVRRDPFERYVSCMVYVPRDRYDTTLRVKLQDILAARFDGVVGAFNTHLSESPLARLHVIIRTTQGKIPDIDLAKLESELADTARAWIDRLTGALIKARGEEQGLRAARLFGRAFPLGYQENFSQDAAVADIGCMEKALAGDGLAMNLYQKEGAAPHDLHFKIYVVGDPVPLSDVLPMLENMGLKVFGEVPYQLKPTGSNTAISMHDFDIVTEGRVAVDLADVREAFHDAFGRVWRGRMENDGFNKLVLHAGLTAREVIIVRSYSRFLRQAAIPFSLEYMEETLAGNPGITRLLVDLFLTLFDPAKSKRPEMREEVLVEAINRALEDVSNLDEDRIIRRFLNAITSTLRTNYFQRDAAGEEKTYVSIKLNSRSLEELPLPKPFREIFVYAPRVEGVHLRFGMVARGGLRWSDRREDFRTEILGLVKAQQVKNAVIVPVGSKGGFVVKRPPAPADGRQAFLEEGIACYKTLIAGLLDITDNLKGGDVVPPPDVVRRDGDDAYLVVAADKGTATFSDIANGVSADYGFWLDDAFASGGSAGYDHKKMAITARGAWESVKRHFRELGKNIQEEDFACIGVGDMAGDVFGNGMLLSKHIRLLAAFNHMHIFIDPDPDPAASWQERQRLFDLPGSTWESYDRALISKGGGVFDRKAKSIPISAEMKRGFGIEEAKLTPSDLIRALLRAEVELLWFGGIGTYVKSSDESNGEVGDRANDALRVDAEDLRAKVVGEGANLGVTQQGRIEFGMRGGHINTDSIDNSAGVDCSDHEVNIKILLGDAELSGRLTRKQRNRLLESMTEEVAELVLRDNYLQTQAISVTHQLGAHLLDRLARFMRGLEKQGLLDRAIEHLPDDEVVLERQKLGIGMTRPELALLLSYAKIVLYDWLLDSDLPDDPYFAGELAGYFPTALRKKYVAEIGRHRLRREIVATVVTNSLVNRLGPAFLHEVGEKTGMPPQEITRSYIVCREIFAMRALWGEIEALDNKAPAVTQAAMLIECGRLIERATVWFLREAGHPLDIVGLIDEYGEGVGYLMANLRDLLPDGDVTYLSERSAALIEQGVPVALADRVANLALLSPACDIVRIARSARLPVPQVGQAYFAIGARFGFDWLRRAAGLLPADTAWDKLAVTAIIDDLFGHQSELTSRVLTVAGNGAADGALPAEVIDSWADSRRHMVNRTEQLLAELKSTGTPDFAMLAVANRQLKSMVSG